ncbi:MAG: HRDC domain-containing protein [Rikenellaceae bacterium]
MEFQSNAKIDLARELLINTRANIFLTGKAGTGKTTFLREMMKSIPKRCVIAAPTGVAAINAGGVTLHSLFQLPFGPHIPGYRSVAGGSNRFSHRISKTKIELIRSIELLIIDEISMVRSDMLDAIDETLRRIRHSSHPFGGLQLLMIGDLKQLSPICKEEEWELLSAHYSSPYFFDSHALQRSSYIGVEFDHIFRQNDDEFIEILNSVRENRVSPQILERLNRRYIPNFDPHKESDYITLTTHNNTANAINRDRLEAIKSAPTTFKAKVKGDYAQSAYPNDEQLELKVGAQVLFIKNDISPEKRYYNGMLGDIVSITSERVEVRPKGSEKVIDVDRAVWESVEYKINSESGEVESEVKGSFTQFPLRCAWAITIHKSQGMSFDRAIIDASSSFAFGQVYVALSRCRTLEGMVLRRPISEMSIIGDRSVDSFCEQVSSNQPSAELIEQQRRSYMQFVLSELFNFAPLQRTLWDLRSEITGSDAAKNPRYFNNLCSFLTLFDSEVVNIGERFIREITRLLNNTEDNEHLQQRLRSSANYFAPRLEPLKSICEELPKVTIGAAERKKRIKSIAESLIGDVELLIKLIDLCAAEFTLDGYHKAKSSVTMAPFEFERVKQVKQVKQIDLDLEEIEQSQLYQTLREWRLGEAREQKVGAFTILSNATMREIAAHRPTTAEALLNINGIGERKLSQYGDQIIEIVNDCNS